jgi:exonuclease III
MPSEQKRNISLCTWNVCLGARCKLSIIKDLLNDNKIDVLCVQESEIKSEENLDNSDNIKFPKISIETEVIKEDGKTYDFILKENVYWHDGKKKG